MTWQVGGHRALLLPALRQVVAAYERRWADGRLPASALLVSGHAKAVL